MEEIYKELRHDILHNVLKPGTRLVETQLAEKFQTSRTPVREAIAKLRDEGLVFKGKGNGLIVGDTSLRDVEEIMGIRAVLEVYALDEAFEKFTEVDIYQLEFFLKQADYYLKEDNVQAIFKVNTQFHDYILDKSENFRLKETLSNLMDTILRYRIASLHYPENKENAVRRHKRLVKAIKSGDKELAKKLMMEDISAGKDVLLVLFNRD